MRLLEYQGRILLKEAGIAVPEGGVAETPGEAQRITSEELNDSAVVKAQVPVGGRGKAGGIKIADNPEEAERVEAFVGRFGRLQDTLGDKLLPVYLNALGELPGSAVDNLDRAERWELIPSVDDWLTARKLRNQMVHEYIEDPEVLASALQSGHEFVPTLLLVAENLIAAMKKRGWLG